MIDARLANRLDQLEQEQSRLLSQAAAYRLRAFNTIETLGPYAAKVDMAITVLRYAREHWALTGTVFALAGMALRRCIGMLALAQLAFKLGGRFLAR
jgi:hypothetical protein